MNPLVSILIPAYNAEAWIKETLESAVSQDYAHTEVIVVDDGSSDRTSEIANAFSSTRVKVLRQANAGGAAARNSAFSCAQGEYIQWLDHDDLLSRSKISEQVRVVQQIGDANVLFSGRFGTFYFRPSRAQFSPGPLWKSMCPAEYFFAKFEEDSWIHTTCWLVSRRLSEAAGPWLDLRSPDDDGEYFCRVVAASSRLEYVDSAVSYWRVGNMASFSYSRARSRKALEALKVSTFKCVDHFLDFEDSDRSRAACVTFIKNRLIYYYPEHMDLVDELRSRARELGGDLSEPPLIPKYSAVKDLFGWKAAKKAQACAPAVKFLLLRNWDRLMHRLA